MSPEDLYPEAFHMIQHIYQSGEALQELCTRLLVEAHNKDRHE